jgi:phage terminase small subunit
VTYDPHTSPSLELTPQARYAVALAELPARRRKFVQEYLRDLNGTRAALRAGYAPKAARSEASRLLTNVNICEAVDAGMDLYAMRPGEIIARLTQHARGSLEPFLDIDEDGELRGFRFAEDAPIHLLKKATLVERTYKEVTERTYSIELHDPQAALRDLAKIRGLTVDRKEISGPNGGAISLQSFETALATAYAEPSDDDTPAGE